MATFIAAKSIKLLPKCQVIATFRLQSSRAHPRSVFDQSVSTREEKKRMEAKIGKIVRRTVIMGGVTASYLLFTADTGPEPNILDPIKKMIQSAENSAKKFVFGSDKES